MSYFDDNFDRYDGNFDRYDGDEEYFVPWKSKTVACKFCGSTGVKWRLNDAGEWRLFNTERVHPGNRMIEHNCHSEAATLEDFD